ncbi:uncharacterized protein KIAA0825-like [Actinia tenebrosa]|uniref:Uncharacterized protein KIAA0825-like n=1 Tax=Actinia tenebrosa TaxID=6105 RepID=A0A6P8IVL0_ACTTE|nr:uncharacterized protein KIAA0825-like [Actinia tenebrosa]
MMEEYESFSHLSLLISGLGKMVVDLDSIKSAISEIDGRLDENAASLQKELSNLTSMCNESLNPDQDLTNLRSSKEAISLLTGPEFNNHVCDSEPMVLNCFLNNVIQALERNPGLEEAILHELVKFASEQGMILPFALMPSEKLHNQGSDVNPDELETKILWEKIRNKFNAGLWKIMGSLKLQQDENLSLLNEKRRQELIQRLLFLSPLDFVWENYLLFRRRMVENYSINPDLISGIETSLVMQYKDAPANAIALAKLSRAIEMMITQDMKILEGNELRSKEMTFKVIYEIYLEKYMLELRSVLQLYREEKKSIAERRGSSRSTSSMSIHGDDLIVYKLCFLATVSLEMMVIKVLEKNCKGITPNVLKPVVSNVTGSGKTQLPKLTHKSSKDLPVLEAWPNPMPAPFGVGKSDFPAPPSSSHHASSVWAWRDEFKHVISRISSAVTETIKLGCDSSLEEENKIYATTNGLQVIHLKDELVGGQEDYPKCIAKSCSIIMSRADDVLPLASFDGGKLFQVVRSSFVDTLDSCLKTYFSSVVKIIADFPKKCNIQALYVLLSSSVFVRNRLAHYEEVIGTEPRRPFAVLHRQYSELAESLTNQIMNYHKHIIATVILQDTESHNWEDQRPFYEDERCSFSVQMWNLYIQGLLHDMWKYCPPIKAQSILTNILHNSLSTFTLRYSNALPSYNRVKQFRSDITAILLCTVSFLWPCCSSLSVLFDSSREETIISSIHNLCSCLIATMAIVSCPLEELCKCLTSKKKSRKHRRGCRTDWLSWIIPEVLKTHDGSLSALIDRQALNVLFKLMINQPVPQWSLVLHALLLRDARLSVTIVKYGDLSVIGSASPEDKGNPHSEHNRWFKEGISSPGPQVTLSSAGLVTSLYYVLFQSASQSSAVVNFLMALVNREDSWKLFEAKACVKALEKHEFPVWLNCLYDTLQPYILRFLTPSLRLLCERDKPRSKSFNFTSMSSLPCGCPFKPPYKRPDKVRGETDIIYSALREFIVLLADNLNTIPSVISQFICTLQDSLQMKSMDSSSAGLKVLGWLICRWLSDPDYSVTRHTTTPSAAVQSTVEIFSEVIWHVFIHLDNSSELIDNPKFPMNLEADLRSNRGWLSDKLQVISQHIVNNVEEDYQADTIHDEISDIKYSNAAKELLSHEKGAKALSHVYRFLINNKDWLMNLIVIPGHILPPKPSVTSQSNSPAFCSFNPLQKYDLIGEFAFDQAKIASFPFDWGALLQSDLGLVPNALKRLVCHRFEMQDSSYLEESEKGVVEKLKVFCGIKDLKAHEDEVSRDQEV